MIYSSISIIYTNIAIASYVCTYHMGQNFGGRKLLVDCCQYILVDKNIGRLAALDCIIARMKVLVDWLLTAKSAKVFYRQSFVLYGL